MATYKQNCIHCNQLIEGDSRLCSKCGSRNPFGYNCPSCLKPIERGDMLCSGCGRNLTTACPSCSENVFVGDGNCQKCGGTLLMICANNRCQQAQFFENEKCTACGKKITK